MTNQQQLDLLRQGVKDWNTWRVQHPEVSIDLRQVHLSGANLIEADLSGANLIEADLSEANLSEADLRQAHLMGAVLRQAYLSGADLRQAYFNEAHLGGADLRQAHLNGADLNDADLRQAHLNGADLRQTNLNGANLSRADLDGADLRQAHLNGADLSEANLRQADLSEATIGRTIFGNVDLRTVKGLETVKHRGPSTIGTNTLLRSQGNIPEKFLREAGLTDTFITYVRSLTQNPIEYYTCFISYSSKDQEFTERLHADLQAKGVRCWFAPEDMKIGEKFWHRIDESIRLYDKLLVVLSEHSVNSVWVENEVMAALEKEQHHPKPVLFPIKLDETVMQTSLPWAANIRRTRHIGDFTRWKEHDAYQRGLKRLLRDLQPDDTPPASKL